MQLDFYKRPFLHISIPFIIGLLIVLTYGSWSTTLVLVFTLSISCISFWYFISHNSGLISYVGAYFLCFILGTLVGNIQESRNLPFEKIKYKKGDLVQVEIDELNRGSGDWNKAIGQINRIYNAEKAINLTQKILLYIHNDAGYIEKGDLILIGSEIQPIENKNNPGEFDAEFYWKSRGIQVSTFVSAEELRWLDQTKPPFFSRFLNGFSDYLKEALNENLSGNELAIAQALILGDKSLLDTEIKNAFTNTGAMHVLAVSGMHVGLIMYLFIAIFGFFPRLFSKKQATVFIVVFLWIYALISGFSASVIRAVLMFTILALSQISSRQHDSLNTLFLSAFILLLINPLYILDIGFQLSYLAMIGIFLFYPKIESLIQFKQSRIRELWQGTALGFAAQLMTTGISLFYFHQFPNYFVLTNLGLMFFSSIIMGLGFFLFAIKIVPVLSKFIGLILGFSIYAMFWIVQQVESLPGAVAYGFSLPFWLVIILSLLFVFMILYAKNRNQLIFGYSLYFLAVIGIVFQRNQTMNKSELCIFNHNQLVISYKSGKHILCFYKAKPEQLDKIKFLMESYAKINPGEISYYSITEKKIKLKLSNTRFEIFDFGDKVQLMANEKKYDILYSMGESEHEIIFMPWITQGNGYPLKNGAFIREI